MNLLAIHPKLPMRNKATTQAFYMEKLNFKLYGSADYDEYLMLQKDEVQIHFFGFKALNPDENYGQVYIRVKNIEALYESFLANSVSIHPNGKLETKPWNQKEFSLLDPDHNLITFGQEL